MPYDVTGRGIDRNEPSGARWPLRAFVALMVAVGAAALWIGLSSAFASPGDGSTAGANAVTMEELEASDIEVCKALPGPMYDLPDDGEWGSLYCHDRLNRMWIVVTHGDSIAVVPALDAEGNQYVTPQE